MLALFQARPTMYQVVNDMVEKMGYTVSLLFVLLQVFVLLYFMLDLTVPLFEG